MIEVQVKGVEEVNAFLKSIPLGATKEAQTAIGEYIIGNDQHGLKHYPPRRPRSYVASDGTRYTALASRAEVYGSSFQSDRQRRWFFANLKNRIDVPYRQTWKLKDGWKLNYPSKNQAVIKNSVPYAAIVMGDAFQSRMPKKIGWRTVSKVIADNIKGALRMGDLAVQRWIKAKNK